LLKRVPDNSANISNVRSAGARSGRIWIFAVTVLVIVGGWFWASRGKESLASESGEKRVKSTLHLETFVLNLSDNDQRSYLRVGIALGLNHEAKRGEDPVPVAEVRDTILGVLSEAKVDDLLTAQGKIRLKENLLHALQQRMPEAGVEEVYFTEFLIQR
jgi:flagellar protein FliL